VQKTGIIDTNPAEALPLLITRRRQVTKPISIKDAFKLLDSFDQSTWHGLRNHTMVSLLWTLGLRTVELTGLKVCSFETGHGKRIGLLRVHGKNKKQRALFVVDRLFDELIRYLSHPRAPNKKYAPLFMADTKTTAISNNRVQRLDVSLWRSSVRHSGNDGARLDCRYFHLYPRVGQTETTGT